MLAKASIIDLNNLSEKPLASFQGELGPEHCLIIANHRELVLDSIEIVPGSIILTRNNGSVVPVIQTVKNRNSQTSRWSHVAIMGAGGRVWDIMPSQNVRVQKLSEFLVNVDSFAVRIPERPVNSDALEKSLRKFSKAKYSPISIIELKILRQKGVPVDHLPPEELVCSTFVNHVLVDTLGVDVVAGSVPKIWPYHFAESPHFTDIDISDCFFFYLTGDESSTAEHHIPSPVSNAEGM